MSQVTGDSPTANTKDAGPSAPKSADPPRRAKQRKIAAEERKRAVRACDACRKVKEKCEGGVPCRRCSHFKRPCEFTALGNDTAASSASSRITSAYVKELTERSKYMERLLRHTMKGIALDTANLRSLAENIPEENSAEEPQWESSGEEDLTLEEEVCTIDPVEDTTTHFSGEFSYWNFSMRIKKQLEDRMLSPDAQNDEGFDQVPDYWRAEQLRTGSDALSAAIKALPPRQIADILVQVFFEHAEAHYFCVDYNWLLDKINILYNQPETIDSKRASIISIFLTVLAVGTQYLYLEARNESGKSFSSLNFTEDEVGNNFYQRAIRLLPEIIESSSLESVQACLLFALYSLPIDAAGLGYVYIGLAIRLAMQNGMHRKYTGKSLSAAVLETRNRVWWSAYALERKICIFHGRPLSVLRSDADTDLPQDMVVIQRSGTLWTAARMNTSLKLTYYLEDYLMELSSLKTSSKPEIPAILSRVLATKDSLDTWWNALPSDVLNKGHQDLGNSYRSIIHVKLEHCLIRMFVGRPFLLGRHSSRSNFNSPADSTDINMTENPSSSSKRASVRAILVDDCIEAAREAIDCCRILRDNGPGLARASYIEYSSCRASLLVLIARSIQKHTDQFQSSLQTGLAMIQEMSAAGESARSEVSLIEALERALARLHMFGESPAPRESATKVPASMVSSYDRFKDWEAMWKGSGVTSQPTNNVPATITDTTASKSLPTRPPAFNQESFDWNTMAVSQYHTESSLFSPGGTMGPNLFEPFQSSNDLAFFSDTTKFSPNAPAYGEAQVLQDFLAMPDFDFDVGALNEAGVSSTEQESGISTDYGIFRG